MITNAKRAEEYFLTKLSGKGEVSEALQRMLEEGAIREGKYEPKRQEFIEYLNGECQRLRNRLRKLQS